MKELSIEEKAKAYDEAKARMSKAFNDNRCTIGFMNEIFPELKEESDNERIRKALVKYFTSIITNPDYEICGIPSKKVAAWLEKQGEQKTRIIIPKFRVGDIVKSISQPMLKPRIIKTIDKDCYWCKDNGCIGFAWEKDYELVEPKPEWTEEDKATLERIYRILINSTAASVEDIRWFESLKDRVLPKLAEWSEEDEIMFRKAIITIDNVRMDTDSQEYYQGICDWLKALKDRILPLKKLK